MTDKRYAGSRLHLQIAGLQGRGIEAGKLSRLLVDLSTALSALTAPEPQAPSAKRAERPADADGQIEIRVVLIGADSAFIEARAVKPRVRNVLHSFAAEVRRIRGEDASAADGPELRGYVQAVLRDAAEIGPELHVRIHGDAKTGPSPRSDKPPKSALELAAEQGLQGKPPPDYGRLATFVWETDEQLADAEEQLHEIRR